MVEQKGESASLEDLKKLEFLPLGQTIELPGFLWSQSFRGGKSYFP